MHRLINWKFILTILIIPGMEWSHGQEQTQPNASVSFPANNESTTLKASISLASTQAHAWPSWFWSILLFVFCFLLGILAITAGVGGGVLFVPFVSALFPFHLDYVRGAGLLVALTGAISASPQLLKTGMGSLRLALPLALFGSIGSLIGASIGLSLPFRLLEISMGILIIGVVSLMFFAKGSEYPVVPHPTPISIRLGIFGDYTNFQSGQTIQWNIHRLIPGLFAFLVIGLLVGLFGMGGGWASVPVLNLLMGVPLKVSAATSILIIAINGSVASWLYLNQGLVLPIIAVPSVAGMMLGTRIGARMLVKIKPVLIRRIVIGFLVIAGIRSILG